MHALVSPKQAQTGEDPELAKLYTRWDQFQGKMQAGEHFLELRNWAAAREDFQAALGLIPGNAQATAKLELCERRLHPALPGFEIEGDQYDSGTGLPKEVKVAGLGIPMVLVPGGEGDIGSDDLAGAQPVNTVRVEAFYLGKYELTQAQWKALMGTNPSVHQGNDLPVERVSWLDCQALLQKLNEQIPGQRFSATHRGGVGIRLRERARTIPCGRPSWHVSRGFVTTLWCRQRHPLPFCRSTRSRLDR